MWTFWIIGAALIYAIALALALAFVAGAARGSERWERGLHDELEELHRERTIDGFHRAA